MRVVGLIPARGNSKGIPRKNLALVDGRPLLRFTIDAALAADELSLVAVSTDDDEIAAAASDCRVLQRPAPLATDEASMLDVVLHAVEGLGGPDVVCVLQPTSPLRRPEDIDAAVQLLRASGADGVVSVVRVPHRFTPESLMSIEDGRLVPVTSAQPVRRQDKRVLLARNGPAVLVVRTADLAQRGLYGGDLRPYEMPPDLSVDVDEPFELELVRLLVGARRAAATD
jgi:CMP-N-acetylneuraminic acid synthetase